MPSTEYTRQTTPARTIMEFVMRDVRECQPFLVHLRAEHERLDADVRSIEGVLATRSDPLTVLQSLSKLRDDLVRHFEEEQRGGCIEEAACRCPSLSRKAAAVEREHPDILRRLNHLIEQAADRERGIDERFSTAFRQFARTIHAHEAAENRILKEAFGCANEDDQ